MKKIFFSLVLGVLTLTSCSRDEDLPLPTPVPTGAKEATLDASKKNVWKYFSFSKGTEVTVTDPDNDLNWDIAFQRLYVKTNSGFSGKGKGGVVKTDGKDFSALKQAPTSGFLADDKKETVEIGYPPQTVELSYNSAISGGNGDEGQVNGFASFYPSLAQQGKTPYITHKWVYVVKTADGKKFVKLQVTDYVNEKNQGGYPKFTYQVSNDGKF